MKKMFSSSLIFMRSLHRPSIIISTKHKKENEKHTKNEVFIPMYLSYVYPQNMNAQSTCKDNGH